MYVSAPSTSGCGRKVLTRQGLAAAREVGHHCITRHAGTARTSVHCAPLGSLRASRRRGCSPPEPPRERPGARGIEQRTSCYSVRLVNGWRHAGSNQQFSNQSLQRRELVQRRPLGCREMLPSARSLSSPSLRSTTARPKCGGTMSGRHRAHHGGRGRAAPLGSRAVSVLRICLDRVAY